MAQPAPRITRAPEKKRTVVLRTDRGEAMGTAKGAAIKVENMHGQNR